MAGTNVELLPGARELWEWLSWPGLRSWHGVGSMRIEDSLDNGQYVIRAELPGIDPDTGLTVTVSNGLLKIHAERHAESKTHRHDEFTYGSLDRILPLPEGADEGSVTARYDKGVLELRMRVEGKRTEPRTIPIESD
jgi:HSP20 family molecular chaperone IbpA